MTIADHASKDCPSYNVESDQAIILDDLARELSKHFQIPVEVQSATCTKIDLYISSIKKAKDELGLSLRFNLEESISETVKNIMQIRSKL